MLCIVADCAHCPACCCLVSLTIEEENRRKILSGACAVGAGAELRCRPVHRVAGATSHHGLRYHHSHTHTGCKKCYLDNWTNIGHALTDILDIARRYINIHIHTTTTCLIDIINMPFNKQRPSAKRKNTNPYDKKRILTSHVLFRRYFETFGVVVYQV